MMGDMPRMRPTRREIVAWVAGGVVAALLVVQWADSRNTAVPHTVEGWATTNAKGTAIWLTDNEGGGGGEGYVIAGARWAWSGGGWHDGGSPETCVGTDTTVRTRVRLGLIEVDGENSGWTHVVWLQCLGAGDGR